MLVSHRKTSPDQEVVLVLAPHTDDAEIGLGGTIARLVEEGASVHIVAFSTCEESLPPGFPPDTLRNEMMEALPILGVAPENIQVFHFPVRRLNEHRQEVLDHLIKLRTTLKPSMIFIPSAHDMHQDHTVVHQEGVRAFKNFTVFGYELPWNNVEFNAQAFFPITKSHLEKKIQSLGCYCSQITKGRHYFDGTFIEGWARLRGVQICEDFAEVFEVVRFKY